MQEAVQEPGVYDGSMHGIIFAELKKYVDQKVGPTAWEALLEKAGMPGRIFLPVHEYPDPDAVTLVSTASAMTVTPPGILLEEFGEFIAPDLLRTYASQLRPEWRTLDVGEHTEETVHTVVRRRNPGAAPPYLHAVRTSPEEVVVHYTSARR